jgi:hypothetical protein
MAALSQPVDFQPPTSSSSASAFKKRLQQALREARRAEPASFLS